MVRVKINFFFLNERDRMYFYKKKTFFFFFQNYYLPSPINIWLFPGLKHIIKEKKRK